MHSYLRSNTKSLMSVLDGNYMGLMLIRITRNETMHGPVSKASRVTGCAPMISKDLWTGEQNILGKL